MKRKRNQSSNGSRVSPIKRKTRKLQSRNVANLESKMTEIEHTTEIETAGSSNSQEITEKLEKNNSKQEPLLEGSQKDFEAGDSITHASDSSETDEVSERDFATDDDLTSYASDSSGTNEVSNRDNNVNGDSTTIPDNSSEPMVVPIRDNSADSAENTGDVVDTNYENVASGSLQQETEVIDLESYSPKRKRDGDSLVVDLTADNSQEDFVDLTRSPDNFNGISSPDVQITSTRHSEFTPFESARQRLQNFIEACSFDFNDTSVDEILEENLISENNSENTVSSTRKERKRTAPPHTREVELDSASSSSPRKTIVCPICLEDDSQIKRLRKQLTSTTCGHIFCDKCIRSAVMMQKKCPTCRKKLSLKQLHPIYL